MEKGIDIEMKKYRCFLYIILTIAVVALGCVWVLSMWLQVPSDIMIKSGVEEEIDFHIPATANLYKPAMAGGEMDESMPVQEGITVNMANPITFYGKDMEQYEMDVRLFGIIPLKTSQISVIQDTKLIPAGTPIGIYVKTNGVLVIDTGKFVNYEGLEISPVEYLLKQGDYILQLNGEDITNKNKFIEEIGESGGRPLGLTIDRNGEVFTIKATPVMDKDSEYKLGIWIRDNAQGVGTLTYLTKENEFGALGHGINDMDTSTLMNLQIGELYKTEIISIKKGVDGTPGELTGVISYSGINKIGDITANTIGGIFGHYDNITGFEDTEYVEIALKHEIQLGYAQIKCTIDKTSEWYDVKITGVNLENGNVNRGIELEVVDERLLDRTGGIVQGMSGSPIIQNGKLIGAVTHVFVNDPTRGYGIFIESMLETAESVND